jgi:hypothetical protein
MATQGFIGGCRREHLLIFPRVTARFADDHFLVCRDPRNLLKPNVDAWVSPSEPMAQNAMTVRASSPAPQSMAIEKMEQKIAKCKLQIANSHFALCNLHHAFCHHSFFSAQPHDSRTTNSAGSATLAGALSGSAIRRHNKSIAVAPIRDIGTRTVVNNGLVICATRVSSKPTTPKSCGTDTFLAIAPAMIPAAISSLAANTQWYCPAQALAVCTASLYAESYV